AQLQTLTKLRLYLLSLTMWRNKMVFWNNQESTVTFRDNIYHYYGQTDTCTLQVDYSPVGFFNEDGIYQEVTSTPDPVSAIIYSLHCHESAANVPTSFKYESN